MTIIRRDDEAPAYEGPVVPYIKERIWYGRPQKQPVFVVYLRASNTQETARMVGLIRPSKQRGMAEITSPFLSCWVFKVAHGTWAVAAWLFIPPPCCSSPGSWHCHFTGKGPWRQSFPGNWTEDIQLLVRQLRLEASLCQERKVQFMTCLSPNQLLIHTMTQANRPDIFSAPWKGRWNGF